MPRVNGNSPGNARSRSKSRFATSFGVASGFTSMLLTVVKSFFHGPRFATTGSWTSRRHLAASARIARSDSGEKSGSCSASDSGGAVRTPVFRISEFVRFMSLEDRAYLTEEATASLQYFLQLDLHP